MTSGPVISTRPAAIPAILLAGGKASRMGGGDKCLRLLAGKPILRHVIERVAPQTAPLLLNANGDAGRFAAYGLEILPDDIAGQPGPLAGILTGLDWAAKHLPGTPHVLSISTDCPFLPTDLVSRLHHALKDGAEIAIAASNGRNHPVIGLWPVALRKDLRLALAVENQRRVESFCDRHRTVVVNFPGAMNLPGGTVDPFFNANTPEDLAIAERLCSPPH